MGPHCRKRHPRTSQPWQWTNKRGLCPKPAGACVKPSHGERRK
jgi:hypothetical protein